MGRRRLAATPKEALQVICPRADLRHALGHTLPQQAGGLLLILLLIVLLIVLLVLLRFARSPAAKDSRGPHGRRGEVRQSWRDHAEAHSSGRCGAGARDATEFSMSNAMSMPSSSFLSFILARSKSKVGHRV